MFVLRRVQSATVKQIYSQGKVINLLRRKHDFIEINLDGETLKFPHVWLRDNCQCEKCFHATAKSRIIDYSKFNIDIKTKQVTTSNGAVEITWEDGHSSSFKAEWLKLRSFTKSHQKDYSNAIYKPKKTMWHGSEFFNVCGKHDYNEVLKSDKELLQWLHNLSVYGIALIENTPNKEDAIDAIISRVGFSKETHYGKKFVVQNVSNTSNVAYLSAHLPLHIDLPYYEYCPGVNLLHCLEQTKSEGGVNLLSDSHYVASYMKQNHPEQYKLLTDIEIEWSDIGTENGNDFFKLYRSPVICLDKHGEIIRINFSIPQRGHQFPEEIDKVVPWYEAHKLFFDLSHKFAAKFKTKQGDILVFDNIRLLHGRNTYTDTSNNTRKLVGTYIDWDEIFSRWRCLQVKFNTNTGII